MKRQASIGVLAVLLTGCATAGSDCVIRLPAYTRAEQALAAAELPQAGPQVRRMIEDYGQMRAEWRAACGK